MGEERKRREGRGSDGRIGERRGVTAAWNIREVELCEYALTSASSVTHCSIDCAHER
jgi:hypothetical protein